MNFIKTTLLPVKIIARRMRQSGIPLSFNDCSLKKYKDKHRGGTCFIIGSGPSLKMEDLDRVSAYHGFGVNKIYLAFPHTIWRPTYYVIADKRIAEEVRDDVYRIECQRFVEKWAYGPLKGKGRWNVLRDLVHGEVRTNSFSRDLLNGAGGGATVLYACLQIAYYMGYTKVVLLGVDFSYGNLMPTGEISKSGELLVTAQSGAYFTKDYSAPGRVLSAPRYDEQRAAFKNAYEAYTKDGRILVNASRRTELDVIPRRNLEDVLREIGSV